MNRLARAEAGEVGGQGAPLAVAALDADVVEAGAVGDLGLDHRVQPRRAGAALEQGQVGAGVEPDQVAHHGVGAGQRRSVDEPDAASAPAR